jgi:hypothetical protein
MYFDSPYGYDLFPHDQQITTTGLISQSKQFDAFNTQKNHTWIVMHKPTDSLLVQEAMLERGYKNLSHVFWHKPNQYVDGPNYNLTPVVEMGTVGCIPGAASVPHNMNTDPRKRPNMISIPSVTTLSKDTAGNILNPTEKPPGLARWLLETFCPKGSNVLIVGTGAGGCLKGAVIAGMNVIGVENDEKQFHALQSEMNAWVAGMSAEKKKKQAKSLKQASDTSASPEKKPKDKPVAEVPVSLSQVSAIQEGKCFGCDGAPNAEDGELLQCALCDKMLHKLACLEQHPPNADGSESDVGLICGFCKRELALKAK